MGMRTIAVLMAAAALVAGCGEDDEPAQPAGTPEPAALADLKVEVDPDGKDTKPPRRVTIVCDAPEDSPGCKALSEVDPQTFEPTPDNVACTQQFGGPQTATVTGTLRGEPIDATFSRANGCEISRWQDAAAILDAAG
jgi:hypothetical protein